MKRLVAVVSHARPGNVQLMEKHGLPDDTEWYVKSGEGHEYRMYGAKRVREVALSDSVTDQREAVLRTAWYEGYEEVVMIDDDLRRLKLLDMKTGEKKVILIPEAISILSAACDEYKVNYAGVGPTDNAYFVKKEVHLDKYVRSALIVVRPSTPPIWYDTEFRVKEDYDFSAQHLAAQGAIARVDTLLASFQYKTNRGGCQLYRNDDVEQEAIARLLHKWPGKIKRNSRRENEVLMRWR